MVVNFDASRLSTAERSDVNSPRIDGVTTRQIRPHILYDRSTDGAITDRYLAAVQGGLFRKMEDVVSGPHGVLPRGLSDTVFPWRCKKSSDRQSHGKIG